MSIQKLQNLIQVGKPLDIDLDLENLLPTPISDDTYATILFAVSNGIIDPVLLLQTTVKYTIEKGEEYYQMVGLALRVMREKQISPNVYITIAGSDDVVAVVHILYYVWLITPKTPDAMFIDLGEPDDITTDQVQEELDDTLSLMLQLLAILAAGGCDPDLPVIDPNILLQRRRELAYNASAISQSKALVDTGIPRSVLRAIVDQGLDTLDESAVPSYIDDLQNLAINRMIMFYKNRDQLSDLYNPDIPEFEGPNRLIANMVELLDQPASVVLYPIGKLPDSIVITVTTDENGIVTDDETYESMNSMNVNSCINQHANKCVKKYIDAEVLTFAEAEAALLESLDSFNITALVMLLDAGLQPRYNDVDTTIFSAEERLSNDLPFSAALMNNALIKMCERGMGFDDEQLKKIYDISPSTHSKIKSLLQVPYWKRTCSVPYGLNVRKDLRELARELNLPPDIDKRSLCIELVSIDEASPESLEKIAFNLRQRRLKIESTSIGSMVRSVAINEKSIQQNAKKQSNKSQSIKSLAQSESPIKAGAVKSPVSLSSPAKTSSNKTSSVLSSNKSVTQSSIPIKAGFVESPTLLKTGVGSPIKAGAVHSPVLLSGSDVQKPDDVDLGSQLKNTVQPSVRQSKFPSKGVEARGAGRSVINNTVKAGAVPSPVLLNPGDMLLNPQNDEVDVDEDSNLASTEKVFLEETDRNMSLNNPVELPGTTLKSAEGFRISNNTTLTCSRKVNSNVKMASQIPAYRPICKNADRLARDETDYADVDLVMIPEGIDTYCFETSDYETLLERGINSYTKTPLTLTAIKEIEGKLDTLRSTGMPLSSKGIRNAIMQVKNGKANVQEYEKWVRQTRATFYDLCEDYGIDKRNFTEPPSNGGISNEELADIARKITEKPFIEFDVTNREAVTRSFSVTLMELVVEGNSLPDKIRQARQDDIFNDLSDLINQPISESTETVTTTETTETETVVET